MMVIVFLCFSVFVEEAFGSTMTAKNTQTQKPLNTYNALIRPLPERNILVVGGQLAVEI